MRPSRDFREAYRVKAVAIARPSRREFAVPSPDMVQRIREDFRAAISCGECLYRVGDQIFGEAFKKFERS